MDVGALGRNRNLGQMSSVDICRRPMRARSSGCGSLWEALVECPAVIAPSRACKFKTSNRCWRRSSSKALGCLQNVRAKLLRCCGVSSQ